jgi:hypothetical protein
MRTPAIILALALVASIAVSGCGQGPMIAGTNIPDTEENWEVLRVLERYRKAFVQLDAARVLATAHPTYYDVAGTDDPSDDVVYEDLGPMLRKRMAQLDKVRFTIDYLDRHIDKHRATVHVWIDASFQLKPPVAEEETAFRRQPRTGRKQDYAQFELLREGEIWLITRGL